MDKTSMYMLSEKLIDRFYLVAKKRGYHLYDIEYDDAYVMQDIVPGYLSLSFKVKELRGWLFEVIINPGALVGNNLSCDSANVFMFWCRHKDNCRVSVDHLTPIRANIKSFHHAYDFLAYGDYKKIRNSDVDNVFYMAIRNVFDLIRDNPLKAHQIDANNYGEDSILLGYLKSKCRHIWSKVSFKYDDFMNSCRAEKIVRIIKSNPIVYDAESRINDEYFLNEGKYRFDIIITLHPACGLSSFEFEENFNKLKRIKNKIGNEYISFKFFEYGESVDDET